jgi:2-dehydropantoate 2-reductase
VPWLWEQIFPSSQQSVFQKYGQSSSLLEQRGPVPGFERYTCWRVRGIAFTEGLTVQAPESCSTGVTRFTGNSGVVWALQDAHRGVSATSVLIGARREPGGMDVVVVGAGSLGSLIGGMLATEHDVRLVARDRQVHALEEGLEITGEMSDRVSPAVSTAPPESADLVVVAVKTYDTAGAAETLAGTDLRACLSLQNGLDNEETFAERLDATVLAGSCTFGARLVEPGHVECTGVGEVALGARNGGESALADDVGAAFEAAGIETAVATDMPRRLWTKLSVNAGVNGPTALARVENGALAEGPVGDVARAAAVEAARVARSEGIALSGDEAIDELERVVAATAANRSSMLQDVDAGRRTEVDAIYGPVVERADEPAPMAATLASLVRGWERGLGLR